MFIIILFHVSKAGRIMVNAKDPARHDLNGIKKNKRIR